MEYILQLFISFQNGTFAFFDWFLIYIYETYGRRSFDDDNDSATNVCSNFPGHHLSFIELAHISQYLNAVKYICLYRFLSWYLDADFIER